MKKAIISLAALALLIFGFSITAYGAGDEGTSSASVESLTIVSYPERTVYGAFEKFDGTGLSVSAALTDGSERLLAVDDFTITYEQDNCFRVGDEYVRLSYGGITLSLPVTVNRISYDLSGLSLSSFTVTYDGTYQSYSSLLPSVVGLDGIPLIINAKGGGTNAGIYDVSIDFKTQSRDYITPESRVITMTIEPAIAEIVWSDISFTYDGKSKVPAAYYIDVNGNKVYPAVTGAATNAGNGYTARAIPADPNYNLSGLSVSYEIKKADYDFSGVRWSTDSFIYDGSKKSISASGLPLGVSIIGYSGDRATNAGQYTVTATLSWDKNNYNTPEPLTHSWEIKKADYDMSSVSFKSESFVFDGKIHYPTLVGKMPKGKDGISLEYSFSAGACHVNDGVVSVIISFFTESKNYNLPAETYASVTITPLGIEVSWGELNVSYTGEPIAPSATAQGCTITVEGKNINVGKYVAKAIADSSDYYVINDKVEYSIVKAQNHWTVQPGASTCYEGREIRLVGESRFGTASYTFYSDAGGRTEIPAPTAPGRYYAVISVSATENYGGLRSQIISFEIVKIEAVSFLATITRSDLRAFEQIKPEDMLCCVINNDGSETVIDSSLVKVIYSSGESLRRKDTTVTLKYGKFTLALPISVGYADYDLSGVIWQYTNPVYDGKPKTPLISGLPDGVRVIEYIGSGVSEAGSYKVSARVEYDRENYNEPDLPVCDFTIQKCQVQIPIITVVYNGEEQIPVATSSIYRVTSTRGFVSAGRYAITVELSDKKNYVFAENASGAANAIFEILPATLYVSVPDVRLHLFEPLGEVDYRIISGSPFGEDVISAYAYLDGKSVLVRSKNPNYIFDVTAGKLIRLPYPTLKGGIIMLSILMLAILAVLVIIAVYRHRFKLATAAAVVKCRWRNRSFKAEPPRELYECENIEFPETAVPTEEMEDNEEVDIDSDDCDLQENEIDIGPIDFDVDAARADMLITDSLAKSLLKKDGEIIYTDGSGKSIVNVDTISDAFLAGDRVDVNSLKEKGIVPADTAYIKVLARGRIDKPLNVYANEFSLSAIKMIALTGGQSVKIVTRADREKG